ncbi:MAG: segregation/condensation protein A [Micrococcales bacterium]|nr:segregation/condensation protein A [Micrococcales bacterium]
MAEPALPGRPTGFDVHLEVFEGPLDLLLTLIARHKLDVTEVALAQVTDEFIAYIRGREDWDLSQASDFVLIAATLLDIKAARLLPTGAEEDPESIALLEARDLLFARLLQYRAFKEVAARFSQRLEEVAVFHPRLAPLEPQFAAVLPDLVWMLGPGELAAIAREVFDRADAGPPSVDTSHLRVSQVSVAEQADVLAGRLRRSTALTFRDLVADVAGEVSVIVARFLALLELFKAGAVAFEQVESLGELTVLWTGLAQEIAVSDEYERIEQP